MKLEDIEKRFCEVTKLDMDLTQFPFTKGTYKEQKQETIKELSNKYGFVPTPIFLVDAMIAMEQKNLKADSITCDFCAGCGQYTIRLLRYLYKKFNIDVDDFLTNNHYITELQAENCAALIYVFGNKINLYVGDSLNLKYSDEDDKGILFFNEETKKWEHNKFIDQILEDEFVRSRRDCLSFIFNNYKKEEEVKQYIIDVKTKPVVEEKEEEQVKEITVEEVEEVVEQIKEPKKKVVKEKKVKEVKEKKVEKVKEVKEVKEVKPKKQAKKKIGDNTKEEADEMFGFAPLKVS